MEEKQLEEYNVEQLATILGVGKSTAYKLVRTGRIQGHRTYGSLGKGDAWRIPKDAVERYMERRDSSPIPTTAYIKQRWETLRCKHCNRETTYLLSYCSECTEILHVIAYDADEMIYQTDEENRALRELRRKQLFCSACGRKIKF